MSVTVKNKDKIIKAHAASEKDTGSPEVQVAILTERITNLSDHMKSHTKDLHSRLGLIKMVGQRRRLLDYIKSRSLERYKDLITKLNLRR
ncbi:MAG: 30S ribosomal protein S15 [Alphaproteobacteria bacterium]|jgi:small subunit ribosomal protein S15|nr:30S ribosomal protein S15 [Alphaproteobacteria bacterium]